MILDLRLKRKLRTNLRKNYPNSIYKESENSKTTFQKSSFIPKKTYKNILIKSTCLCAFTEFRHLKSSSTIYIFRVRSYRYILQDFSRD